MLMVHGDLPRQPPVETTVKSFERVWKRRGWVPMPDGYEYDLPDETEDLSPSQVGEAAEPEAPSSKPKAEAKAEAKSEEEKPSDN
jgi:hypothetical protein